MLKCKRAAALLLTGALLLGTTACGAKEAEPEITAEVIPAAASSLHYEDKPTTVRKAETVYVNLDNSGKKVSVNVTDWIHTDKGEVAVDDVSDLKNITDIKSNYAPVQNGTNLTWHMPETDLYYSGTSDKQLPVEFSIEYKLNGKKMSAEKIAGKKGKAEVTVHMKNVCEKDGMYLPVVAAGLMILPEGTFSGIEVQNGMTIGDGAKQIVVGMGVPGMADSLGLSEDAKLGSIQLGNSFTVTANTDSFSLDNLYFAVLPICSMDLGTLIPGTDKEAIAFFDQVESILKALGNLDAGKLMDALSGQNLADLTGLLSDAVSTFKKNEALLNVLSKYMTEENLKNIGDLLNALQDPETVKMMEALNSPLLKTLLSGMPDLLKSIEAMTPMLNDLQKDLQDPEVQKSLEALPETLQTLTDLKKVMDNNSELLKALGDMANSDLVSALSAVAESEDAQTIINDLTGNADTLLPNLKSYIAFGKEYGLFTDAAEGTDVSLVFIYMTPSLHPKAVNVEESTTEAKPWYKKIF